MKRSYLTHLLEFFLIYTCGTTHQKQDFFFMGVIFCELLNLALKYIIAQPRPYSRETQCIEYGMPSSHSQLSWFFTVYCILFVICRLKHSNESGIENLWKTTATTTIICAASLITYSRVYLLYHSWSQVFCGFVVGVTFGSIWFGVVHLVATPYFPTIASWNVSEFLMIRDTSLIPNVLWFEYTQARLENRSRNRKLVPMKSQ